MSQTDQKLSRKYPESPIGSSLDASGTGNEFLFFGRRDGHVGILEVALRQDLELRRRYCSKNCRCSSGAYLSCRPRADPIGYAQPPPSANVSAVTSTWKKHCPYDIDQRPACRQAWREGWIYRKDHGSGRPAEEVERRMTRRLLYSSWLQGYSAADDHLPELTPEARR